MKHTRHEDVLKALQLIDEMVDKDVPINKGFCQKGHKDVLKALQLIDEMVDKDVPINKGFCQKGLPDEAYKVFRGIEEGGCLLDAYCYNVIIQGSLRHKDVPKALQLIDEMVDKGFFADATTTDLIYIYRAITISF
ncbi:pentatricopeptide repeat-containing protein At1g12300, mitochondrial-like [Hevea brasiliensis]|uniref:pentatricopeptide repeat-containing protein At1g12300, mitochondrial-like n=1 Tax=Hevea brasiliensis TaxID=3981 RepID=UPI0025F622E1|nr:pentatricopeptide repeat-containing protein At1g12300, mitochondrial-like [Hevea brasiliensis]